MCFGPTTTEQKNTYGDQNQVSNASTLQNTSQAGTTNQATSGTSSQATSSTRELPAWLQAAAQGNYDFAKNIAATPFRPYGGELAAPLTPQQLTAGARVDAAAAGQNPYLAQIQNLYGAYGAAPAATVSSPSILGGGYDAATGAIQDYLNPYIKAALTPQLAEIERAGPRERTGAGGLDAPA